MQQLTRLLISLLTMSSCALPGKLVSPSGSSTACDAAHDHCIKPETWFQAGGSSASITGPATPVFQRAGAWLSYEDQKPVRGGTVFRTQVAVARQTKRRDLLIVLRPNDGEPKWPESAEAAQTTARWQVFIVDKVDADAGTFTTEDQPDRSIPFEMARSIVESQPLP